MEHENVASSHIPDVAVIVTDLLVRKATPRELGTDPLIDAVRTARQRCWRYDWVLDLDVRSYFDSIDWELMLKAVRRHTDCPWVLLYIERWLKAPVQMEDGSVVARTARTPQGGVISPLLANLFLHYAFDMWMARTYPHIPFERYADDAICHCRSAEEAQALWKALVDRFAVCKLVLHPEKTKIVYCKDVNRRGDHPNQAVDFLGFTFRARKTVWHGHRYVHGFRPAVSPKALKAISRTIRGWALHHRSDKSLQDLAAIYNPCIRGWINYYGQFYRKQLRPTLLRIATPTWSAGCSGSSNACAGDAGEQENGWPGFVIVFPTSECHPDFPPPPGGHFVGPAARARGVRLRADLPGL